MKEEPLRGFERALAETKLPERPDYEAANRFLIKADAGWTAFDQGTAVVFQTLAMV